jgi:cellulose synthase/poly-beta-1,6-N-acetylglucosamine synthase-like glycosyltransferase
LGYPVLIYIVARCFQRPVYKAAYEPTVSVVISLYNEEAVIARRIENLLSLDYPADKIEFLIGSDGSTDATLENLKSFRDGRIRVKISRERKGKMAMLNDLVASSTAEIIVFGDARQVFDRNAIRELTANFSDKRVGCVSGELVFDAHETSTAKGINVYWEYEKFIRDQESRLHSMLGATGAIYAIRRSLFVEIPHHIILDDMFVPLQAIKKGYRAVIDRKAKAFDRAAEDPKQEHRRKTRTLAGNFQIFMTEPAVFNPVKSPIAWQMFSHKLLRVCVPLLLVFLMLVNYLLIAQPLYAFFFWLQVVFYALAVLGWAIRNVTSGPIRSVAKVCAIPYVFCLLNYSALVGLVRFLSGRQDVTWKKAKE